MTTESVCSASTLQNLLVRFLITLIGWFVLPWICLLLPSCHIQYTKCNSYLHEMSPEGMTVNIELYSAVKTYLPHSGKG